MGLLDFLFPVDILRRIERNMVTKADFDALRNFIAEGLADVSGDIDRLTQKIADLIAGGSGISQADAEAILADFTQLGTSLRAIADRTAPNQP